MIVAYPCQRDGPEGYDSPVPASERLLHRAQAEALQGKEKRNSTHTHRTATHTDKLANEILLKVYFLFPLREFLKVAETCDKRFQLKSKYLEQESTAHKKRAVKNTKSQRTNSTQPIVQLCYKVTHSSPQNQNNSTRNLDSHVHLLSLRSNLCSQPYTHTRWRIKEEISK